MLKGKVFKRTLAGVLCASLCIGSSIPSAAQGITTEVTARTVEAGTSKTRMVENLNRGLVAVNTGAGVYLSWRFLGTDAKEIGFDVYRDGVKITETPITDSTNYLDTEGKIENVYEVHTVVEGRDTEISETVSVNANSYFDIPLQKPEPGYINGVEYTYSPGDGSCGDLDGDGEYEIVVKWDPSNSGDNMADGFRGNVYLDAYKMDGTLLWRIDLGRNIRAGQHYTPFLVYDFDADGYAEVVCKTADGTVDGLGNVIGDAEADWRGPNGEIITGPEYLTLFDGFTGENIDTVNYEVARGDTNAWGDSFGNRSERYLAAVAYLNGTTPSIVMCRGYYVRTSLSAWDVVDKKLVKRWIFDSNDEGNGDYAGQGNHNLAVADVDRDGYDEIVYGSCTIDHDGTGLYTTGLGHGDALHVGDFDPEREGLEVFQVHEHYPYGASYRAAEDGTILWRKEAGTDTGRGIAGNFTPNNPGAEFAAVFDNVLYNTAGEAVGNWSDITKWSQNFAIYWDGNLEREAMDRTVIEGYGGRVLNANGVYSINSTKSNCTLSADLFGDWREEVIWPSYEYDALRVFTTTFETEYRIPTLMHDTQYRCQVASQNVGYNQPPNTSYFLGTGYDLPEQPDVLEVEAPVVKTKVAAYDFEQLQDGTVPDITGNGNDLKVYGNAVIQEDADSNSSALYLDGTTGTYAELPQGLFDGLESATIEMDVKAEKVDGNFFTFAVGADDTHYLYLKTMDKQIRSCIRVDSDNNEKSADSTVDSIKNQWVHLTIVIDHGKLKLYKDRELIAENTDTGLTFKDLGTNLLSYLGKSFYSSDAYFAGAFDHVEIYNYARTKAAISHVEYVNVNYQALEGGSIEGKTSQTIQKGTTTGVVTAVAEDGWKFIRWSDGVTDASRQDAKLTEDVTYTAIFGKTETVEKGLIAAYDFEEVYGTTVADTTRHGNLLTLYGTSKVKTDEILESNALYLDGKYGTYAELPQGLFDHTNEWTVQMKVKVSQPEGNFFTFTVGRDDKAYIFLKTMNERLQTSITLNSYTDEQKMSGDVSACKDTWMDLTLVVKENSMALYKDQELLAENNALTISTTDMGENLLSYLGKSFYGADAYFNGAFDDIKVYNYALSEREILKGVENVQAADTVIKLIEKIGTVDKQSKTGIDAARKAYRELSDAQKEMITNYEILVNAESAYKKLIENEKSPETEKESDSEKPAKEDKRETESNTSQEKENKKALAGTVSLEEAEKNIVAANTDKCDVKGSSFASFRLKAKEGNKSVKLSWSKISGADGYLIYGAACGKKMKQIADISAGKKSYTVKKLSKGKYYKYMLIAYKEICKEKRMIASSVTVHCVTKGGKYKNPTGLSYDKKKIILKPKKCVTLKPTQKSNGKVKEHIAKFHYESSDPTIATVNKKGKVKGIKTGKCYIYIYTQNGLYKRIAVHVK